MCKSICVSSTPTVSQGQGFIVPTPSLLVPKFRGPRDPYYESPKIHSFPVHKVTGVQGKHQGSRFAKGRRFQDSRAPMVTGLQESTVAGFHKAPRFPSSVAVTGFQGCNVTGQKLQACTRIPRMLVSKLFRVPRFQDSRVYRSRLFMVPLFQNLMT